MTQTVILRGDSQREDAVELIGKAAVDSVVRISPPKRSLQQNARLWAMLTDVSRAKPEGREHMPEVWKSLFMAACGHAVAFEEGLDGRPFPVGFRSSRLTKRQMSDLMEFIAAWGSERGVLWSEDSR